MTEPRDLQEQLRLALLTALVQELHESQRRLAASEGELPRLKEALQEKVGKCQAATLEELKAIMQAATEVATTLRAVHRLRTTVSSAVATARPVAKMLADEGHVGGLQVMGTLWASGNQPGVLDLLRGDTPDTGPAVDSR